MQTPTGIDGLRKVLRNLGYSDVLAGIDPADHAAMQLCKDQVQYQFNESAGTWQDEDRKRKAFSYIERFPWSNYQEEQPQGLSALLEEEQVLAPKESVVSLDEEDVYMDEWEDMASELDELAS